MRQAALRGGERGPAVVAGATRKSYLPICQPGSPAVHASGGEPIRPAELKTLAAWIDGGALWPGESPFTSTIKPLLEQRCISCHHPGAGKASGLDLTSREKLLEGGDHGPVVVLDNPESSVLVGRFRHTAKGLECRSTSRSCRAELVAKVVTGFGRARRTIRRSKLRRRNQERPLGVPETGAYAHAQAVRTPRVVEHNPSMCSCGEVAGEGSPTNS